MEIRDIETITQEKVVPQNLEAEMSVLGSMLIEEDAISRAVEILNDSHFYKQAHRKIFSAIINLYENDQAVDGRPHHINRAFKERWHLRGDRRGIIPCHTNKCRSNRSKCGLLCRDSEREGVAEIADPSIDADCNRKL